MCPSEMERKAKKWRALVSPYFSSRKSSELRLLPSSSALLVVDMQRYFLDKESHAFIPSAAKIVDNLRELIAAYRRSSLPVLFTRHALLEDEDPGTMGRWWGDVLREGNPMSDIVGGLGPIAGEAVVRKTQYSAFVGTALEKVLRGLRVDQLVVTGVQTHLCCESTARDAFMKGFDVFVVLDATASKTEELHVAALRTLAHGFAVPLTTKEVLRCLE